MLQVPDWDKPIQTEVDEPGKLLLDAVAYLRKHGHCHGAFFTDDGRVCAYTALNRVAMQRYGKLINNVKTPEWLNWHNAVQRLCDLTPDNTIINWNDFTPTHEVIRTMEEAACTR